MTKALLFNDTSLAGHHGCTLVIRQISMLAELHGISISRRMTSKENIGRKTPIDFDIVIINGEGSLHSSNKSAIAIADMAYWCDANNIPCFLINSIYQNNKTYICEAMRLVNQVYVRDRQSLETLQNLDIEARYTPDLTLSWSGGQKSRMGDLIVVTDSTLKTVDETLFNIARSNEQVRYLPLKAKPLKKDGMVFSNIGRRFKFFAKRYLLSWTASAFYSARYRNAIPDFDDFVKTLTNSRFILAGRFHAVCLAIDLEIPFVTVSSNSWKVENLLREAGLKNRLVTLEELNSTSMDFLVDKYGEYTTEELSSLRAFKESAETSASSMFAAIANETAASLKQEAQ